MSLSRYFLTFLSTGPGFGSPIDPALLPNREVDLWATTAAATGNEGDLLASWADISGNARNASGVAGQRPTLRKTTNLSPSGQPVVEFNAHIQEMTGVLPAIGLDRGAGFTVYTFFRINTAETAEAFFAAYLFGSPFANFSELFARGSAGFGYPRNDTYGMGTVQAGQQHISSSVVETTGWHSLIQVMSPPRGAGGSMSLYLDGNLILGPIAWDTNFNTGYNVGGTSGNAGLLGGLGRAVLFSEAHSDFTRAGVRAWGRGFYGGG